MVELEAGSVFKIEAGFMDVQVQQPLIVQEQLLVQQQPAVQEPALRTPDQRPALRIFVGKPKLYILLYQDGEMETLTASRPGLKLWRRKIDAREGSHSVSTYTLMEYLKC